MPIRLFKYRWTSLASKEGGLSKKDRILCSPFSCPATVARDSFYLASWCSHKYKLEESAVE